MENKTKGKTMARTALEIIIGTLGYMGILALISWMFRTGVEDNNTALLVISGVALVIHSFFIIWLNYDISFLKFKRKKRKKKTKSDTK